MTDYIGTFSLFADAEWIRHGNQIRLADPWQGQFGSYLFRVFDDGYCMPYARLESGALLPLCQHNQRLGVSGKAALEEAIRDGRLRQRA
jgi:hypothetical protein